MLELQSPRSPLWKCAGEWLRSRQQCNISRSNFSSFKQSQIKINSIQYILSGPPINSIQTFSSNQSEHNDWLHCSNNSHGRDRNKRDGVVYKRSCSPTDCVCIVKGWQRNSGDCCCQVPLMIAPDFCWRSWIWTLCQLLEEFCWQLFWITSMFWAWGHSKTCPVFHLQVLLLLRQCLLKAVGEDLRVRWWALTPGPLGQTLI